MTKLTLAEKPYITPRNDRIYKVVEGSVYVFIAPLLGTDKNRYSGRRMYFCTLEKGDSIPSLLVKQDEKLWCIVLQAQENATLEYFDGEEAAAQRRAYRPKNKQYRDNSLSFEEYMCEYYQVQLVSEERFLYQRKNAQEDNKRSALHAIYDMFVPKAEASNTAAATEKNELYAAAALLCAKKHMDIVPLQTVIECTKRHITVENIARISHFLTRKIVLEAGWRRYTEPMLAFLSGTPVLLCRQGLGGYKIIMPRTGEVLPLSKENLDALDGEAYQFYRPLSEKSLTFQDLLMYTLDCIPRSDTVWVIVLGLAGVLIGLLMPTLNQWAYDSFIPMGRSSELLQLGAVILACTIGNLCFTVVKNLSTFRLTSAQKYKAEGAVFERLFSQPPSFLNKFRSADLAQRTLELEQAVNTVISSALGAVLGAVFSLLYVFRMFSYNSRMSWMALVMLAIYQVVAYLICRASIKWERERAELAKKGQSQMYQYIAGIDKLRVSGTESTALYQYILTYTQQLGKKLKVQRWTAVGQTLAIVVRTVFSMVFYFIMVRHSVDISLGKFIAFTTAFGSFSTAILTFMEQILALCQVHPLIESGEPILKQEPEGCDGREIVPSLDGEIEVDSLTFGYEPDRPVLENINFHIHPGEYVAFVGPSGSGKSTLLKMLLGFENPDTGKVYYDQKDLEHMEKREFRKHCGVVLQNGQLVPGSIFENITIATPGATKEQVDKVIEAVGLKDDIAEMPMGVHTMVSEGASTISGGQRQRMLLARAIINRPNVLFLDEATSALDNITQAKVCDSLEKLKATRVVIAHRLSTVMHCDVIYVLEDGKIVEQGNYETLMANNGLFSRMAKRQME